MIDTIDNKKNDEEEEYEVFNHNENEYLGKCNLTILTIITL